jgi:arylsulfatase A-like enzyme
LTEQIPLELPAVPKEHTPDRGRQGFPPSLLWGAAGAVTGALAALVDTFDAAISGFEGQLGFYAWYATSSLVLALGLMGALLGTWVQGARWLGRRLPPSVGPAVRVILIALPCAAFVAWVPTSWIVEHWRELKLGGKMIARGVYLAAAIGSVAVAAIVIRIVRSYRGAAPGLPRFHPLWLGASAAVAAASYFADRWVLVGLYDDFHYGLAGAFLACLTTFWILAFLTLLRRRPGLAERARYLGRPLFVLAALAVVLIALVAVERLSPDVFGSGRSPLFPKLLRTARAHTDFDRDGLSSLFGGSDCAPFNPRIRPGVFDMPGNRLDEDCTGSDSRWPKRKRRVKYPAPRLEGYNVLLITIDAFRADHVGAYGYKKNPTTPNIDRLAKRAFRFAEAFSPSPKTIRTMPSLATGLYPSNVPRDYGAMTGEPGERKRAPLSDDTKVIAEVLQARGYQTFAVHGVSLRNLGLARGFDQYQTSKEPTPKVISVLDARARMKNPPPFFGWLHYYSPHHTYQKREGFDFGDDDISRYDSEIAHDDHQIGILLDQLDARGLTDRTIVVLTADHGEEFRDHGGTQHGFRLYRELTHVPLVVFVPGMAPVVVETPVELVDIYPTLCELLHISRSCPPHDGQSLIAAVAGKRKPERGAYSEIHTRGEMPAMNALFDGRYRIIYDYELDRAELYDEKVDRTEQHNLASALPDVVRRMRGRLAMRPIESQAAEIADYLRTKDARDLVMALPRLRHERLLKFALDQLATDMKPSYVDNLEKLRARVGLSKGIRKTIDALIRQGQSQAKD